MEQETIIIQTGKKSSCLKETKFGGDPKTDCVSVHVGHPESVTVFEGHPHLYTESEVKAERLAGQYEAWELAQKIAGTVANGSYDWPTLRRIFGKDWSMMKIFDDSYETVKKKISDYQSRPKVGDMVCVHSGNNHYDGRLALVVAIRESKHEGNLCPLLKVVFDDGDVSLYPRDAVDYIKTVGFDKFFSEEEEEE